jgi:hypothetical protein
MASKIGLGVLAIGLFAGTLDIGDALIFNVLRGITPIMVLQYIGSGLIGAASFSGGLASAVLGLVLHYLIALSWTTLFYIGSRKLASGFFGFNIPFVTGDEHKNMLGRARYAPSLIAPRRHLRCGRIIVTQKDV